MTSSDMYRIGRERSVKITPQSIDSPGGTKYYIQVSSTDARHGNTEVIRLDGSTDEITMELLTETIDTLSADLMARAKQTQRRIRAERSMGAE